MSLSTTEKIIEGINLAENLEDYEAMEKLATDQWFQGNLNGQEYKNLLVQIREKKQHIHTTTPIETRQGTRCQSCGLPLTYVDLNWGRNICVECEKRRRGV